MGGIANVVSGIQQGMKAIGGIFEAIGQFVPQFKQIGAMLNQASSAMDVMNKIEEKAQSEEAIQDQAKSGAAVPAPASPLAGTGFNTLQEVQSASGKVNGILDQLKSGKFDAGSILSAIGK